MLSETSLQQKFETFSNENKDSERLWRLINKLINCLICLQDSIDTWNNIQNNIEVCLF